MTVVTIERTWKDILTECGIEYEYGLHSSTLDNPIIGDFDTQTGFTRKPNRHAGGRYIGRMALERQKAERKRNGGGGLCDLFSIQ